MQGKVDEMIRLMLVADQSRDLVPLCQAAERGGVTSILIQLPDLTPRDLAVAVRALIGVVRVPVLVGGRADVAIACGAAGVHLGSMDVPLQFVRRIAPKGFVIGVSVGSHTDVENGRGADYWSVGPFRRTGDRTMPDHALGPAGVANLVRQGEGRPCVLTGGVLPSDIPVVRDTACVGVSVALSVWALSGMERLGVSTARS